MSRSFPCLRVGLLVGIGGGVSKLTGHNTADIRLGDVAVSDPTSYTGGVILYDLGKTSEREQRPERTGTLNEPPTSTRTAVASLKANHEIEAFPLKDRLDQMIHQRPYLAPEYTHQGENNDVLYEAAYRHQGRGDNCANCLESRNIFRHPRLSSHPHTHYGTIVSGNQVVKDSVTRDSRGDTVGVLYFEMEAAGLMDNFPCLVIRGICDYTNSHKNKRWHPYAAATAAAYAKYLLLEIAATAVQPAESSMGGQPESGA